MCGGWLFGVGLANWSALTWKGVEGEKGEEIDVIIL